MCLQEGSCVPVGHTRYLLEGAAQGYLPLGPSSVLWDPASLPLLVLLPDPMRVSGGAHRRADALPGVPALGPCCPERHLSRMRTGKLKAWEPR